MTNYNEFIDNYEDHIDENEFGVFYAKDYPQVSFVLKIDSKDNTHTITLDKITKTSSETEAELVTDLKNSKLIERFNKLI